MINPSLAFTPAQVIDDPERFAGRHRELQELAEALDIPGGHIMVYGNRGIGKSSLAQQLMLMAQGHATLIDRLEHKPFTTLDYLPIYIQCDDYITNVQDLIVRLLTTDTGLSDWIPYKIKQIEGNSSLGGSLSFEILKLEGKAEAKVIESRPEITTDIMPLFFNALNSIANAGIAKSGILIVIDEFDRVSDRSGLASVLKSLDSRVKFALVGVSTNVAELIGEHESVARQFTGGCVKVDPMSPTEISDLFDRAEIVLDNEVTFPPETRSYISSLAKGHPFLVHLLGRSSTISAIRRNSQIVEVSDAKDALSEIAAKGTAPIQEGTYKQAVAHSYTREIVLKEFSFVDDEEIHTTVVYQKIAEKLGMKDPAAISVYMGHLTSERYGRVLERTKDRYYRFRDSLFKAYAASRPLLHNPNAIEAEPANDEN